MLMVFYTPDPRANPDEPMLFRDLRREAQVPLLLDFELAYLFSPRLQWLWPFPSAQRGGTEKQLLLL